MERVFVWVFVLLFSVSFVFAVNDTAGLDANEPELPPGNEWGDIDTGNEEPALIQPPEEEPEDIIPVIYDEEVSEGGDKHTLNFYIALGVGLFGILIVLLFVYLFFRGPKDSWRNRKSKVVKV